MKIVIPTLRKVRDGVILVDDLIENLMKTTKAEIIEVFDKKRSWNKCILDTFKPDDDYMVFDDDIVIIDNDWEKKLEKYKKKYDIIGFKLLYPNKIIQHYGGFIRYDGVCFHPFSGAMNYQIKEDISCPYVTFSVIWISKEVLKKVSIIDKDYLGGSYFEDADFCFRAREAGFKVGVVPIEFIHLESYTKKQDEKSNEKFERNLNVFKSKWSGKINKEI